MLTPYSESVVMVGHKRMKAQCHILRKVLHEKVRT